MKGIAGAIGNRIVEIILALGFLFIVVTLVVQGQAPSEQIPVGPTPLSTLLPTPNSVQTEKPPIIVSREGPDLTLVRDGTGNILVVKPNPRFNAQGNIRDGFSIVSNFRNGQTVDDYESRPAVGICQQGSCIFANLEGLKIVMDVHGNLSVFLPPSWHRVQ